MVEIGSHGVSPHIFEVLVIIPYTLPSFSLLELTFVFLDDARRNRFTRSVAHMTRFVSKKYPHIWIKSVATHVHFRLSEKLLKSPIYTMLKLYNGKSK